MSIPAPQADPKVISMDRPAKAAAEIVIRADHLDLTFETNDGPVHALRDITLDIPKGAFVSFIGPSGCGKTTFLRCIAALEQPTGGSLTVNGMTPDAAREKIQEDLEGIVPSAQVQLSVEAGQQNSVDLVGGVGTPGTYPLPGRNYTILSLLAQGGGIDNTLRNPVVRLIRDGRRYEIRAERLMAEPQLNTTLRGNDKIVVEDDDRYFTALGATGREELVYFERETTTALEALSMIGGLSDGRANLKSVLVLRDYPRPALRYDGTGPNHEQVVFTFDLTSADGLFAARKFQINPDDTVFATEAIITSAQTVLGLFGSMVGISNAVTN